MSIDIYVDVSVNKYFAVGALILSSNHKKIHIFELDNIGRSNQSEFELVEKSLNFLMSKNKLNMIDKIYTDSLNFYNYVNKNVGRYKNFKNCKDTIIKNNITIIHIPGHKKSDGTTQRELFRKVDQESRKVLRLKQKEISCFNLKQCIGEKYGEKIHDFDNRNYIKEIYGEKILDFDIRNLVVSVYLRVFDFDIKNWNLSIRLRVFDFDIKNWNLSTVFDIYHYDIRYNTWQK